jgi:hypothetical protein
LSFVSLFFILLAFLAFFLSKFREEKLRIIEPRIRDLEERKKEIKEKAKKLKDLFGKDVVVKISELGSFDFEALFALKEEGFEVEEDYLIFPGYKKKISELIREREEYDLLLKNGELNRKS